MTTRAQEVEECYRMHADSLSRFAVSIAGASAADDVLAAAVLGVLESRTQDISDVRAYLYRAVHHAALQHWRSTDRRTRRERRLWTTAVYEIPEVDPAIALALETMSPQQRAVVHLAYWEDLTNPQIAARLGIGEGTVKRHRSRSHEKLRGVLHDHR